MYALELEGLDSTNPATRETRFPNSNTLKCNTGHLGPEQLSPSIWEVKESVLQHFLGRAARLPGIGLSDM